VIAGVRIEVDAEAVWIRSHDPLRVVSSALVGGGLARARHIVNMHVPDDYRADRPPEDLAAFVRRRGITEPFVGLMTAARTDDAGVATESAEGVTVTAVVTVGLGGPVSAGASPPAPWRPSTINVIVVLDARLWPETAVNGIITATEAKVAALWEADIRTPEGLSATGTVTDAVALAWTARGPCLSYLGPAAPGGWLLARAVRRGVAAGIKRA
jgi:iron complex transport system ATP-binding protein